MSEAGDKPEGRWSLNMAGDDEQQQALLLGVGDAQQALLERVALSFERFTLSFERIATTLEHLHETCQRYLEPPPSPPREPREAVVSRVPTAEDRIRETHGASAQPLSEWLSAVEDEEAEKEFLGRREREWLDAQSKASDPRRSEKADTGEPPD